jgi:hypothetical protein
MKSVVICGSKRFKSGIRKFAQELRRAGVVVYEPFLHQGADEWQKLSDQYKRFTALGLTLDHFYKIQVADVVFVYNQDGYIGNSVTLEMGCAVAMGKPIYALSDKDEELCRKVLVVDFVPTAKKLLRFLKQHGQNVRSRQCRRTGVER